MYIYSQQDRDTRFKLAISLGNSCKSSLITPPKDAGDWLMVRS